MRGSQVEVQIGRLPTYTSVRNAKISTGDLSLMIASRLSLLDLVLRHPMKTFCLRIDARHDAGGKHALLAEDPVAGVDDQVVMPLS